MIVPLTLDDANIIAFNMREVDVREIMAMRRDEYRYEFAEECMIWGVPSKKDRAEEILEKLRARTGA